MKKVLYVMVILSLVAITQASMVAHLDFGVKNTPYTVDDYTDVTGNGYNGDEAGTWWNYDGDTNPNADLWDDVGGARGGVYAHRTAYEQYYETQVRIGNAENNRVTLASTPTIAANAGITLALWVNPEEDHVIYGNCGRRRSFICPPDCIGRLWRYTHCIYRAGCRQTRSWLD